MALVYDARCDHVAHASAVRSLSDLPEEVLLLIMERVPLIARLRSCSLVCRSMHKAAAAVTCSIKVPSCRTTAAASADRSALQLYLQKYGHQLTSISLHHEELCISDQNHQYRAAGDKQQQRLLTLQPCSMLQELLLSGGRLQPAVLHAPAATLTKLVLQSSVQLVKSPTAGQFDKWCHGWNKTPGVLLEDEWSDGSESDAEFEADSADPSESDDEGSPNSPQASTAPLGQQFHMALQHLSKLKHLQLDYCSDGTQATRFGKALPHLTHLTHLKVWWYCVDFKPWRQHLRCLTDLRVLTLYTDRSEGPCQDFVLDLDQHSLLADEVLEGVQHLQHLTGLHVGGLCLAITAHSSSTLGRLTGLQELQLSYASCDLSALVAITGLRSLALQHCRPSLEDGPDQFWRPEPQPVSKQQLQAALVRLQHLTYLRIEAHLCNCDSTPEAVDDTWELPAAPWSHYYLPYACTSGCNQEDEACEDAEQSIAGINAAGSGASFKPQPGMEVFAAFTASSCLQHLDLNRAVLQFHTWRHMFPAGRTLLQLTCLRAPYVLYSPRDDDPSEGRLSLSDADVEAMVSCCPALQALDAANVLHLSDKPHLGTLQHLTRLEAMWGGEYYTAWDGSGDGGFIDFWGRVNKAAAARELSKLANLRQLMLFGRGQWGECLFRALQQLSHLTLLQLNDMSYSGENNELTIGEAGLIVRLTGLRDLDVTDYCLQEAQLLQLASLPQLTRLRFTPAADMSAVFAQALKSFKFTKSVAGSDSPRRWCTIESTAEECFDDTSDILHQLLQALLEVYQQQGTTSAGLREAAAHHKQQLHSKDRQLARLHQQLADIKSSAEQQKREHDAAVEAAATAAVLQRQELSKAQQRIQEQQQQLEQQRLQMKQQQQEFALRAARAEQKCLDREQLHIEQIKQQHELQLSGQQQTAQQQALLLQQQLQELEQQRLQMKQQQQEFALRAARAEQKCLDREQLHVDQIKQQHELRLRGQQQAAQQQALLLQQQHLAVQQRMQVELAQKDVMLAQQQQQLAQLQLRAAQTQQQQRQQQQQQQSFQWQQQQQWLPRGPFC